MPPHQPSLVLIAADDQPVRDALEFALRLEGFGVRTHSEEAGLLGDPALTRAACVILDDRKPHVDAFGVLSRMRARDLDAPVILLTGYVTARLRTRAAAAGFRAVLEKPLLNNILLETLETIIGNRPNVSAGDRGGRPASLPGAPGAL